MASFLLGRTLRFSLSPSILCRRHIRPLFYSSLSSPSSSPLIPRAVPRSLGVPPRSLPPLRFASSKVRRADETLKQALKSEIDCAVQEGSSHQEVELPDGFPFEIIDTPGDQSITLKRDFPGESIQVIVFMDLEGEADDEDDEDDDGDNKDEGSVQPTMSLVVKVDKGDGPVLEFCCNLNSDELSIKSMVMKKQRDESDDQGAYQGPEYSDLDEKLQKALHTYLEVRGIKSSLFDFLQEYMLSKDEKEYVTWLKNMMKFIEN